MLRFGLLFAGMGLAGVASGMAQTDVHVPGETPIDVSVVTPFSARYNSYDITVRRSTFFGRDVFSLLVEIDGPGGVIVDHMGWDATTLEMVYRQTPYFAKGLEFVVLRYDGGRHEITRIPLEGGKPIFVRGDVGTPVFEAAFHSIVLGTLPLAPGFATRLPSLATQRASDEWTVEYTDYRVVERERITTPEGSYLTWVVEADNPSFGAERLYLIPRPPFVVRRIRRPGTARESTSELEWFSRSEER